MPLITTEFGTVFDVNITIGIQTFPLTVDTGSNDIYVMQTGYSWSVPLPKSILNISLAFGVRYGDEFAVDNITLKGQKGLQMSQTPWAMESTAG